MVFTCVHQKFRSSLEHIFLIQIPSQVLGLLGNFARWFLFWLLLEVIGAHHQQPARNCRARWGGLGPYSCRATTIIYMVHVYYYVLWCIMHLFSEILQTCPTYKYQNWYWIMFMMGWKAWFSIGGWWLIRQHDFDIVHALVRLHHSFLSSTSPLLDSHARPVRS